MYMLYIYEYILYTYIYINYIRAYLEKNVQRMDKHIACSRHIAGGIFSTSEKVLFVPAFVYYVYIFFKPQNNTEPDETAKNQELNMWKLKRR